MLFLKEIASLMLRALIAEFWLVLVPFALFILYLLVTRRNPLRRESWAGAHFYLLIAGLILVIAAFLYAGITAERYQGGFRPAHVENGEVLPGQFR